MNKKMILLAAAAAFVLAGTEVAVYALTGDLRVTGELRADGDAVLPSGSIGAGEIASDAVTEVKLLNGAVTSDKISSNSIATAKLQTASVTTVKMYIDAASSKIVCVTSNKVLGVCSNVSDANGGCTCSSGL